MARATAEATLTSSQSRLDLLADVCKFGKLNGTERQELFSSFEKGSSGVRDVLHSWSRRQLKDYLNIKTGVEKKYTSYSKHKLIDRLLSIGLTKSDELRTPCPDELQNVREEVETVTSKVGKGESPSRETNLPGNVSLTTEQQSETSTVCKNSACRGKLSVTDLFCKRCSCCICHLFDDNKDPSLWIVCNGRLDDKKGGCNLSCHVECALKLQVAGVTQRETVNLDGSFCCPSCGTVSDLIECLKKQLFIAKEARRIDILCYRLYLAYRLLTGTTHYQKLFSIVSDAAHKLEEEIGPLNEASSKLVRGIVSRLSSGAEVQKLLQSALQKVEHYFLEAESRRELGLQGTIFSLSDNLLEKQDQLEGDIKAKYSLHFIDVTSMSITVSWNNPNCGAAQEEATFCDLEAGTQYAFKLLAFGRKGIVAQAEGVCFTKDTRDNLHNSSTKVQPKTAGKSESMYLGVLDLLKPSVSSLAIDDLDTTFKVRNLGNALHTRQLESSATEPMLSGIQSNCREEGLKCEQLENLTSDGSLPLNVNGCMNAPAKPAAILFEGGNKKRRRASTTRTQEKASTSNHDPDSCKGATEMLVNLQPVTNKSILDTSIQSECVIRVLNAELSPSVSRSKDSADAHPSESLVTDVLPAGIATSKDMSGAHHKPHGCEIENFTDSNSQQNDEFQLILHPSIEGEVTELNPRKRIAGEFRQGQSLTKWELPHQQQNDPRSKSDDFFEFWVKIVRWLECEGHLGAHFRMRFLSWLGLRATEREKRVITAFFNSMLDDPTSLAEQLMDTFQEIVTKPRAAKVVE
ncbi:hypothetical protein O6H91_10G064000 [Diphasiastrum complanatum]|uniref:Uncharacterized protein n=2 Tax=Diphasiastrum complanatum TaxID=34168 RepID=A0ACC2CHQ1_DIPCM|nr:hypothetical protein O6H91_10G064000 [Diphasiastrum complanatum]KAJ7541531.1 hypothetical protein O6H91_10G064000 [Diphasiastrum complanatum]